MTSADPAEVVFLRLFDQKNAMRELGSSRMAYGFCVRIRLSRDQGSASATRSGENAGISTSPPAAMNASRLTAA